MDMTTRRRGRWAYNNTSTYYGEAGWHLNNTPLVIDWMPDHNSECNHTRRCRGEYQLHGWPGREHESIACHVERAMEVIEQEWDNLPGAARERIFGRLATEEEN